MSDPRRRWTEDEIKMALALLAAGVSRKDIAARLGRSVGTLYNHLWKHARGQLKFTTDEWARQVERIEQLYFAGVETAELAKIYDSKPGAIRAILARRGLDAETRAEATCLTGRD